MMKQQIKQLSMIGLLVGALFSLGGCANMMQGMHPAKYRVQHQPVMTCQQSSLLITNLAKQSDQRRYLLPDGKACQVH